MTPPDPIVIAAPALDSDRLQPSVSAELASVRERLARLEATVEAHEHTHAERHAQVLDALAALRQRQDQTDARTWKLSVVAVALGLGGGAGASELVRTLLGG
jgi:septal ring factor EnvC (AmiA/AmiB activator)